MAALSDIVLLIVAVLRYRTMGLKAHDLRNQSCGIGTKLVFDIGIPQNQRTSRIAEANHRHKALREIAALDRHGRRHRGCLRVE